MDKFEYKVRAEEIRALIAKGEYAQAAEIADTIDWRRIKSVMMLCTISDLYKINRRYEDARDMLLLAYDRHPGGRTILYALCELSIKMEDILKAIEYFKEFVKAAPRDTGKYILQYKLYEAQEVNLEDRIAVLEELKKRDYREKWAYELAYLYHRVGLSTRCVEECDELILWFGDGKYVIKALELKMLHHPLTPAQQQKYEQRFYPVQEAPVENADDAENTEMVEDNSGVYVGCTDTVDAAAGENEGYYQADENEAGSDNYSVAENGADYSSYEAAEGAAYVADDAADDVNPDYDTDADALDEVGTDADFDDEAGSETDVAQTDVEPDVYVRTVDVSKFNTINLQKELAEGLKEVLGEEDLPIPENAASLDTTVRSFRYDTETESLDAISVEDIDADALETTPQSEVFFGETAEMEPMGPEEDEQSAYGDEGAVEDDQPVYEDEGSVEDDQPAYEDENWAEDSHPATEDQMIEQTAKVDATAWDEDSAAAAMQQAQMGDLADALSVENDGQISMVLPEALQIEKQITGQMRIQDILDNWENVKKASDQEQFTEEDGVEELVDIEDVWDTEDAQQQGDIPAESDPTAEAQAEEPTEPEAAAEAQAEEPTEPEAAAEAQAEEPMESEQKPTEKKPAVRNLTKEEKELFGHFIQNRSFKEKLVTALDRISMASYTGNVIVTGDMGLNTVELAKAVVKDVQMSDRNFSGKIAKISGENLNAKDVALIVEQLRCGALIIEKASGINDHTAKNLATKLSAGTEGIIVVMEDTPKAMKKLLNAQSGLAECFNARIEMEALSNDALVMFAKKYAREMEYSIDEMGTLALHTRIAEMQLVDHAVTIMDVKEIMDEAIDSANRKTLGHFMDILFARRYDEEDMIILKEKDFV